MPTAARLRSVGSRAPGGSGQSYLLSIALIVSSRLRRMRLKDRANTANSSLPDSGSSGTAFSALLVRPMLSRSAEAETLLTGRTMRSEEHTSELQSPDHLVCRLLLEKKKDHQHVLFSQNVCPSPFSYDVVVSLYV